MRTSHVCPKCQHATILLIDQVPDAGEHPQQLRPLHIASMVTGKTFMGEEKISAVGTVSAAVCRGCGYAELYVNDAASIPVDGKLVRQVTGPAPARR